MHQAGSDSLLTYQVFFKLLEFQTPIEEALKTFMSHNHEIYGYDNSHAHPS
jgi:hypothetical protein